MLQEVLKIGSLMSQIAKHFSQSFVDKRLRTKKEAFTAIYRQKLAAKFL